MDIITNVDYIGGMVGLYSGDIGSIVPVNALVLGDLYSSNTTANNVRRILEIVLIWKMVMPGVVNVKR